MCFLVGDINKSLATLNINDANSSGLPETLQVPEIQSAIVAEQGRRAWTAIQQI